MLQLKRKRKPKKTLWKTLKCYLFSRKNVLLFRFLTSVLPTYLAQYWNVRIFLPLRFCVNFEGIFSLIFTVSSFCAKEIIFNEDFSYTWKKIDTNEIMISWQHWFTYKCQPAQKLIQNHAKNGFQQCPIWDCT